MFICLFIYKEVIDDNDNDEDEPDLIEDKPVTDAAVDDVVLDVFGVTVAAQEPMHLDLHQEVANGGRRHLNMYLYVYSVTI